MSTPFYEYMDTIVSPIELEIRKNISSSKLLNKNYYQNIQFSIDRNKIETLKISRENKSKQCDIRAIIRFFQTEIIDDETNQKTTKDSFPFYLQIYVNGKSINLPQYLPYDRVRKDGRRHPQPVDITDVLLNDDISQHKCVIKWIPYDMEEKFFFVVHLVRRRGCDELSLIIMKNQTLSIENTLNFIMELTGNQKNHLADKSGQTENVIITSLNCPISWIRMTIPVRGQNCTHLQCFDCVTYLIMNFRKPMWLCPICSERTLFLSLRVDSFILQVIKDEQSKFIDEISINKLGQWKSIESFPLSNPDEEVLNIKDNSDINGLHNRECDMSSNINIEETTDTNSEELCGHSRSSAFPTGNSGSSESSAGIINADRNSYSSLESRPNVGKSTGTKPAMVINSPIARVPVSPCQNNEDEKSSLQTVFSDYEDDLLKMSTKKILKRRILKKKARETARSKDILKQSVKEMNGRKRKRSRTKKQKYHINRSKQIEGNIETTEMENHIERHRVLKFTNQTIQIIVGNTGKIRKARPGSQPVGRPRKELMAPPPTKVLKDITKARIKDKYLNKQSNPVSSK